jgi:hypothetical protein
MPRLISYEIRTINKDEVTRLFVDSLGELYSAFENIDSALKSYIFRVTKDIKGNIVSSEKLNCKIEKNSFVIKTVKEAPASKKFTNKTNVRTHEIYSIALLETLPTTKRKALGLRRPDEHPLDARSQVALRQSLKPSRLLGKDSISAGTNPIRTMPTIRQSGSVSRVSKDRRQADSISRISKFRRRS